MSGNKNNNYFLRLRYSVLSQLDRNNGFSLSNLSGGIPITPCFRQYSDCRYCVIAVIA